jgi:hypothetical protein
MVYVAMMCCGLAAAMRADPPPAADACVYEKAAAIAGRDAAAHVRLAAWYELRGLETERHKHLAIALEIDPDNAAARGMLGEVADKGEWRMPQTIIAERGENAGAAAILAQYRSRRDKIPDTAQAHWQLAQWCEQNCLNSEALAHYTAVVRLNPSREDAWKKLGYRQQKGRWTTADLAALQHAETEAQKKADVHWHPLLQRWKNWLGRNTQRAEAEAALQNVHDPRAVQSIWTVFIRGGPADHERAVRLLSLIDAPSASRALVSLAVSGASAEVRSHAATALSRRDPREFVALLFSVIRDPIEYEVRHVGGPGNPGELYIHGERSNRRFFYGAPPPLATLRPTDIVGYDSYGLPVANRVVGFTFEPVGAAIDSLELGAPDLTGAPQALARAGLGQAGIFLGQRMIQNQQQSTALGTALPAGSFAMPLVAQVPVGQLMAQAQNQAALSSSRLREDVAALDRYNHDVNQVNVRATAALEAALKQKLGATRKSWVRWWTDLMETSTSAVPPPRRLDRETSSAAVNKRAVIPAFGAGTPVWTLAGPRPVEAILTGDQILTQNTTTGALAFAPVLLIHHSVRQPAKEITLAGGQFVLTDLERLWVASKGWVMVLDLKPGDAIRALGKLVRVASVEDAEAQLVYHVQIGPGRGIIVGDRGILAHDERVATPAASLFDDAAIAEEGRP